MEFKIPPNLVIVLIVVIGLIVLINLNVISFFGTGKKDKDIAVQEYVTNKKIDSLIQVIQENQESIGKYNEKIEEYQKSIEGIDKKIAKNQTELDKITKEEMDDDEMDKAAAKGAKGKDAKGVAAQATAALKAQTKKKALKAFMDKMKDDGVVSDSNKVLDAGKYKEEFAKFKASL